MTLETVIGISASSCTAIYAIPQLVKIIKEKKSKDLSIAMLLVLVIGLGLWIFYGLLKKDWIIIISNSISLLINVAVVVLTVRYKSS